MKDASMKKKYTRKQIVEAINYWKKQIRLGNYKRLNEELDLSQTNGLMGRYLLLTHNSDMLTTIFVFNDENLGKQACKNAMEWYVHLLSEDTTEPLAYLEEKNPNLNKDPNLYGLHYDIADIVRSTNMNDREEQSFAEIISLIDKGNYSCSFEENGWDGAVIGKSKSTGAIEIFNNFYQKYPNAFYDDDISNIKYACDIGLVDKNLFAIIKSKIKFGEIKFFRMDHNEQIEHGSISELITRLSPEIF